MTSDGGDDPGDGPDGPGDGPEEPGGSSGDAGGETGDGRRRRRRRRRRGGNRDAASGPGSVAPGDGPRGDAPRGEQPLGDGPREPGGRERRPYERVHAPASGTPAPPPERLSGEALDDGWGTPAETGPELPAAPAGSDAAPGERREGRRGRRRGRRGRDRDDAVTGGDTRAEPGKRTEGAGSDAAGETPGGAPEAGAARQPRRDRGGRGRDGGRGGRDDRGGRDRGGRDDRGGRGRDGGRDVGGHGATAQVPATVTAPPVARLEQRRGGVIDDDDDEPQAIPAVAWGTDDGAPVPEVTLVANLPPDPPADDDDPLTAPLAAGPSAQLGDVVSACGVRFVASGRLTWFDAGDGDWSIGERVLVDSDRGQRLGWIAVAPARKAIGNRERLRRVIRRANEHDLKGEREGEAEGAKALRIAKDHAAALRIPMKVFRVEVHGALGRGAKVIVYYTSDERLDLRDFLHGTASALDNSRIELRQLGVRDEAKAVGGIGSCGLTLCCTTWLPDFVPVSIKMAKDQGLVLSPTKVSGQCGRLKCCLVYEQAAYAELRKGLPKLGKRVIGARGEGRVVEVDVLRQRVRVSYGPGDTEVVPAAEVTPLFPSGNQPPRDRGPRDPDPRGGPPGRTQGRGTPVESDPDDADSPEEDSRDNTDDPSALANLDPRANLRRVAVMPAPEREPEPLEATDDDLGDLDVPDLPDEDPSRDPNAEDE